MELSFYKGKRVFVTGDTGFKGSWLVLWLLELGAKVTGYALPPDSQGNYMACGLSKRYHHIDGDIGDVHLLTQSMKAARPEIAFHLAAQPLVLDSYKAPLYTFGVNVMGTARFLEAARECKTLRSAVIITTDKVYENPETGAAFTESSPFGGHDPYSASKAAAEIVTQSYMRSFFHTGHCAIATARAGNVIGGGDLAANRIVPDAVRALVANQPLLVRNPKAIRPWQHVLEPLYGYLLLGRMLAKEGRRFAGGWNFGPSAAQTRTVLELAQCFTKAWGAGKMSCLKLIGKAPKEAGILKLNSSKARKLLGWRPSLNFKQTIERTVQEYQVMQSLTGNDLYQSRLLSIRSYMQETC